MHRVFIVLLPFVLGLFSIKAFGQESSMVGPYNSPKGFGLSCSLKDRHDNGFSELSLFLDIYGITTGRCKEPGVRFNYSRNFSFFSGAFIGGQLSCYAGPGVTLGFVKDYEPGFALDITKNHGFCTAVSGDIGIRLFFDRGIALDLGFSTEFGVHLRRGEDVVHNRFLSLYKNGLAQSYMPCLSILFML